MVIMLKIITLSTWVAFAPSGEDLSAYVSHRLVKSVFSYDVLVHSKKRVTIRRPIQGHSQQGTEYQLTWEFKFSALIYD